MQKARQDKNAKEIPIFLQSWYVELQRSIYERETTEAEKFLDLKERNVEKLIKIIEPIKKVKNADQRLQLRLNQLAEQIALLTLRKGLFVESVLAIARRWKLDSKKYLVCHISFHEGNMTPPAVVLWQHLLLITGIKARQPVAFVKRWDEEVEDLMKRFGLETYWRQSINILLLSGTWFLPRHTSIIVLKLYNSRHELDPKLSLEVFSPTTPAEIKHRWKEVAELKKELFLNYQTRHRARINLREKVDLIRLFEHTEIDDLLDVAERKGKDFSSFLKNVQINKVRLKREEKRIEELSIKSLPPHISETGVLILPLTELYYY